MELQGLVNLQLMMFIEIGIGWYLRKKGLITEEGKKVLTDLVIDLILPCNIIQSFMIDMDKEILKKGLQILVISMILQAFCTWISATCYNRIEKEKKNVLQYATVCSNAGFLGNPVAEGLFGSLGLLYASIYLIPQRIVMWSAGVSYFTESPSKKEVVKKVLRHPCIIAVEIGLVLMMTQIRLPGFLSRTLASFSGSTTPVTMLLIGSIMAGADLKTMVTKITVVFSVIRLVLIPLAVFAACVLCRVDGVVAGVSVILAAMPAGSTTAILAAKYHRDEEFASKCVVLTTVLSMAAIPAWSMVIMAVLG
ncbi:MAG: AEC family transporter [Hungatella sp.]|nr:AEC family transporter [Hungatella sp.]